MVALVCCRMERCFLLTTHDSASAPTAGLRHVGFMGLWRLLRQPLVPAALGQTIGRAADHGEGASFSHSRLHGMGPGVGLLVCTLSMRQPGSSRLSEVSYKSGQALHAHAPDTGLRGGQTCVLPAATVY